MALGEDPVVRELAEGVSELHVHLPLEPVFHERMLSASEERRLDQALRETLGDQDRLALVVSLPLWLPAAAKLRECVARHWCTTVMTSWMASPEWRGRSWRKKGAVGPVRRGGVLLDASHAKDGGGQTGTGGEVGTDPQWADSAHFRGATPGPRNGQVVGYAGALEEWFDTELIERAARAHPEWRFVLIGRVEDPVSIG